MANTYSQIYLHFVFSTKNRQPFITAEVEQRVWAYIGGIARNHGIIPVRIGGMEDHIHAFTGSKPTVAPSKIAQLIKGDSSFWIRREFPELGDFAWQDGYGVFSVCKSHATNVANYIQNQRKHHDGKTFEEEYVSLLKLHEIDYDEQYLFG